MIKIGDCEIALHETEFGIELENGFVVFCADEQEAQIMSAVTGGEIRVREVFMGAWAEREER